MPAPLSAAASFIRESTLPRMVPSLASMRWMVGSDSPERSASFRWSIPSNARAARIWPALIMLVASKVMFYISILRTYTLILINATAPKKSLRQSTV
jgi:hypothetical protein